MHDADQILVLDKGHLKEWGTHKTLMEAEGLYHQLYTLRAFEEPVALETGPDGG